MSTKNTYFTVFAVVVALSVAVPLLVVHKPWGGTKVETSELYNRYADKEGIEASFIKDYRVNDSIFVDVTVLEATSLVGWRTLKTEFDIIEAEDLPPEERDIFNALYGNFISMKRAIPGKYNQAPDTNLWNDDVVAIERAEKRVTVFHTANITNSVYTSGYLLEQMITTNKLNIKKNEETN